jgi:hypothetical protein
VKQSPFGRRTTNALVAVVGLSFLSALILGVFGPELRPTESTDANTLSRSAIGHGALIEILRELEVPTVVSHFNSGGKAGKSALLVIAEPLLHLRHHETELLQNMIRRAKRVLVVLPKWVGERGEHGWIRGVEEHDYADVDAVLSELGINGRVVRTTWDPSKQWYRDTSGVDPQIRFPQLVQSLELKPMVSTGEGTLLGRAETRFGTIHLLSDPDVLSNQGLYLEGNAEFTLNVIDSLRRTDGAVVFDETVHGFSQPPNFYRSLFEFPLVLATLQAFVTAVILAWAAMTRFGAPARMRPALQAGKAFLIGNIAALLRHGGHSRHALDRYLRDAIAEVRDGLHAPTGLDREQTRAWLEASANLRGVGVRLERLEAYVRHRSQRPRTFDPRTLAVARQIHRWKEEMIHGRSDAS